MLREHEFRLVPALIATVVLVAACGAPGRVQTVDQTGDFGRVAIPLSHDLPDGLSSVGVDGPRLVAGCAALESRAAALVSDIGANGADAQLVDNHCEWSGINGTALVVGMTDQSGAGSDLDETIAFIDHERSITGVGGRAVYDPDTHALYVIISDRLWYVQLVGAAAADRPALDTLVALARDLVATAATH